MRRIIFFLATVELASGVLQGYYTPLLTDIARHFGVHDADVNWLEAGQLMISALAIPALAKLGDLFGHKRILLTSAIVTALAGWVLAVAPNYGVFLVAWALMGFYSVWLPMEIALVHAASVARQRGDSEAAAAASTRKAAGILVGALEVGVIGGALAGGALGDLFVESAPLVLAVPAVVVTLVCFSIALGVPSTGTTPAAGTFDTRGLLWLVVALVLITGGLSLMRLNGPAHWLPWLAILAGMAVFVPFIRWELKTAEPLLDIRLITSKSMWPVAVTAGLFGVSVLGAQAPLSTFARTDPAQHGYGLGLSSSMVSIVIGVYVIALLVGALLFPLICRVFRPRRVLQGSTVLVGLGYLMFLPLHGSLTQVLINMGIAGLGSGALVAALPAAAAAAAPASRTGMATGLTNGTKTLGGAIASAVFGIALLHGVGGSAGEGTAAPLSGYMTVWALSGGTAVICAILLQRVPQNAFTGTKEELPVH